MTTDLWRADGDTSEALAEGGTWLLDLVAAVDHLRRGHRPGLTVWDALEEAVRWTLPDLDDEAAWQTPDPLVHTLHRLLDQADTPVARSLQIALLQWVTAMAERYNNGHHWPHPQPRRGFPPPLLAASGDDASV